MKMNIDHPMPYSFLNPDDVNDLHPEGGTLGLPIFLKEKWELVPVKPKRKSTSLTSLNNLGTFGFREDIPPDLDILLIILTLHVAQHTH